MGETLYVARSTITQKALLHRHADLAEGATAEFDVHGPIMKLFNLEPERALPLPVDYIVAATGG